MKKNGQNGSPKEGGKERLDQPDKGKGDQQQQQEKKRMM
jgi:hypothetical protein